MFVFRLAKGKDEKNGESNPHEKKIGTQKVCTASSNDPFSPEKLYNAGTLS
jgi:hypothetical protein